MSHSEFLKEMGITEWVSRDKPLAIAAVQSNPASSEEPSTQNTPTENFAKAGWIFFGQQPQGDAQLLFQNIVRALGLAPYEWSWKSPTDPLNQITAPDNGLPIVAFAFGGSVAQKITGERDSLPQLRETILALNTGNEDEIPVIASCDLTQALASPKEKAMLWQDLLLAKSVLQNI